MEDEYGFHKCVNIVNTGEKLEGPKKQRIPAIAEWQCTTCDEINVIDYSINYLRYPTYNKVFSETVKCDNCGDTETFYLRISINLDLVPEEFVEENGL